MGEKNLDFDRVIDRRNTRSLKYDFARERGIPEENLPLWVADMDFRVSSYIQEALERLVSYGIFGYSEVKEHYFEPLRAWLENRHGWRTEREWLVKTPGVVFAISSSFSSLLIYASRVSILAPGLAALRASAAAISTASMLLGS